MIEYELTATMLPSRQLRVDAEFIKEARSGGLYHALVVVCDVTSQSSEAEVRALGQVD